MFAVLGIASCDTDNVGAIYTPTMQNVSFEVEEMSALTSDESYTTTVRLTRNVSAGAYTAHLILDTEDEGIFSIENAGAIEFADGQNVAYAKVIASKMQKGHNYVADVLLSDADVERADTITNMAITACQVSVMCDYNWVKAGKGMFNDILWSESTFPVDILNAEGTNIYRIVTGQIGDIEFTLANDGTLGFKDGVVTAYSSSYQMYWYGSKYPDYCYVTNDNGHITFTAFVLYGGDFYLGTDFGMPDDRLWELDWTEGYPLK